MDVFLWNSLKDRRTLSFVLRRPYTDPFEPAILECYMKGANWPDILFKIANAISGFDTEGVIASSLNTIDIQRLDNWHALDSDVHKRSIETVKVMRFGKIEKVPLILYSAGACFSRIKQGVRLR